MPMWWKEGDQRRLLLHYQPSAPAQSGEATSDAAPAKCVTWNREQIEDFTRKLGFLEKGSEDGITFQRLSAVRLSAVTTALCALQSMFCTLRTISCVQIAQRVFAVQCELVNLGYPQVIKKPIECSDLREAERLVSDTRR